MYSCFSIDETGCAFKEDILTCNNNVPDRPFFERYAEMYHRIPDHRKWTFKLMTIRRTLIAHPYFLLVVSHDFGGKWHRSNMQIAL